MHRGSKIFNPAPFFVGVQRCVPHVRGAPLALRGHAVPDPLLAVLVRQRLPLLHPLQQPGPVIRGQPLGVRDPSPPDRPREDSQDQEGQQQAG